MNEQILTHQLSNGLRLLFQPCESEVVFCGYVLSVGTRHEEEADSGMAHFLEHMTFKGTQRRRSFQINNCLERVGGDLNAYTSKQETVYTAAVQRKDFSRAADLLTDIVFRSTYPQSEIDREAEVICDEIDSYRDAPAELIFDEYEAMLYRGHGLGRDILGDATRLRSYTTADATRFAHRFYVPANAVFYVSGQLNFNVLVRQMERLTADIPVRPAPTMVQSLPVYMPEVRHTAKDTHQAHVVLGNRVPGGRSDERYTLLLLNNILGGPGMNARLNVALREKAGLVYSVDSSVSLYPDTGTLSIYFGCDVADVERCRRLVLKEMCRFIEKKLTPRQLLSAQSQVIGQIRIGREHRENRIANVAKNYALYGTLNSFDHVVDTFRNTTAEALQSLATRIFRTEDLTTLIYSPK